MRMFRMRLMEPAPAQTGEDGGGAAAGAETPEPAPGGTGDGEAAPGGEGAQASAAAAHVAAPAGGTGGAGEGEAKPEGAEGAPATAAAAHIPKTGEAKPAAQKPAAGEGQKKPVDLAAMSDEDYAKLVVPDVDGVEGDRSLIGPMAKDLRALGIQPDTMKEIARIYGEKVKEAIAADDARREASMKERAEACEREITDQQWTDFSAAYSEMIAGDAELAHLVQHTELGSSPAFIRLCALAGSTLRVERPTPAAASAGSGLADLNRRLFDATVPPNLR